MDGVWCERVFRPGGEIVEEAMNGPMTLTPFGPLESQDPVKDFDMIAFTIGYEMSYSNVVNMLRLSQVPIYSRDRKELKNLVFAGGVCAYNPEPLADFVDSFPGRGGGDHSRDCSLYRKPRRKTGPSSVFWKRFPIFPGSMSLASIPILTAPMGL